MADDTPKVVGGKLDRPYPIKTRADLSRARVLPPPRVTSGTSHSPMAPPAAAAKAPSSGDQPKGAFDYVKRRNALQREISGRR